MNKILKEIFDICLIVSVIFVFRSSFLNWYEIPSGSMFPTLKIGDRVVVNKLSYGFMFPFMEKRIVSWDYPERGDIVVFQSPQPPYLTLIKRVVGIGGDTVTFLNGILTINGVFASEELVADRFVLGDLGGSSIDQDTSNMDLIEESGFSHHAHHILRMKYGGLTVNNVRVWKIPPGKLLVVGDNRDNSHDGRFWGYIDQKNIYGRAFMIPYSTGGNSGVWPYFRMDRWFKPLLN